jgi:hypothetical protein
LGSLGYTSLFEGLVVSERTEQDFSGGIKADQAFIECGVVMRREQQTVVRI